MDFNILDLHLDILILIFDQIQTFEDKKNFARTHPKLWNVFAYQCRKYVESTIDFDEEHEHFIKHWDFILEWWGSKITTIYNKYNYVNAGDLIETTAKFCPNLDYISFVVNKDNVSKVEQNLFHHGNLNGIKMRINFWDPNNLENKRVVFPIVNLISSFQSLANLRILNFGAHSLTKYERMELDKLIQLEVLKIGPLEPDDVDDLTNILQHLRVLIIEYYPDTETLIRLAKHCQNLERLSLEDYNNRSFHRSFSSEWRIAYFPKLVNLHIFKGSCHNSFLCHLDSRYNDQLQVLNIPCLTIGEMEIARIADLRALKELFCMVIEQSSIRTMVNLQLEHIDYWDSSKLTKFDLLRLVKESPLNNLRCACDIDKEFISELLDILDTRNFQSDRKFLLYNTNYVGREKNNELLIQFASMPKSHLMNLKLK